MFSTMLFFAAALFGFAAAQFNSSSFTVPPAVGLDLKATWCIAERNVCPDLCGGANFIQANNCVGREIPKFDCICSNGTAPANIAAYIGSVPNSICLATFEQCRNDNPGSSNCPVCGTLKPSDVPKGVASSTKSSTSTPTATEAVSTIAAASAATATGTSVAAPLAGGFSGGLAMGAMACLGLLW